MAALEYVGTAIEIGASAQAGGADVPALVQQDATDVGRTVFIQFTGDSAPTGMVRGDILIRQA